MELIKVKNVTTVFGEKVEHDGLSLHVNEGEIYGLLGPSGCGKTTLLREMVMLQEFSGGSIEILGKKIENINEKEAQELRRKWGVLFQFGALFSSLTLAENIALALREYSNLSEAMIEEIVAFKLDLVGLKPRDAFLYPSEISGGMRKKAGIARALSMDPKLLFLDEPTSGLDPISAREFDELILQLRSMLGLTMVIVTHDLHSIYHTLDRMAIVDNKKIAYEGSLEEVTSVKNDFIQTFFRDKI
jgi:phospholipid/cholesterol/gamma-HCH transport system ATP-binding protein